MNDESPNASVDASPEQMRYANVLQKGMYVGLFCLFATFAIYVFDLIQPHVPREELPEHWMKSVDRYLADLQIEAGWAWLRMLGHGDFINFIGIVILAGTTVVCYIAIIPTLFRNKDTIYAVLAILEVIVLLTAASGVIAVGH